MATVSSDRGRPPRRAQVLASRVVGRGHELADLRQALEQAVSGEGGVTFVTGEPGIGKSRLAQVCASLAADRGLPVLRGRAVPAATPLAYRPLAEALCVAVRSGVVTETAPGLTSFRSILGALVPEWRTDQPRSADDALLGLAEAVVRFLRVAAGTSGCVVVLEDLHWADPETLRIVEYLADNLATERVLCLVTVRDEEASGGRELARALAARRVARSIALSRLGRDEVADMVASCLSADVVPPEVIDLAARADGIPFLIEELLAAAVSSGALSEDGTWSDPAVDASVVPASFAESVRRRLEALGEPAGGVLRAAAILGRRFDWELLPAIAGASESAVLAALRAAVDAQLVTVDRATGSFRFRHALSRDAVVADLLPPERTALSRRALATVEAADPHLEDGRCELAAQLAEAAGDRGRAGQLLVTVGRRSLEGGALASAEAALERARGLLAVDDPALRDVEDALSEVLALAGKRDRAVEVGASLLVRLGDEPAAAERRAEVHLRLARAALAATDTLQAGRLVQRARDELAAAPEAHLEARLQAVAARIEITRGPEAATPLAQAALEAAERLDLPEVACEALEVLGRAQRARDLAAAEAAFARALATAEAGGLTVWRARALHELGTIDMLRGDPVTRLEEARELTAAQGALATAAVVDVQIAAALVLRDDPEPAAGATRRSAALARRYGLDQTLAAALALEAHVHARAARAGQMQRCAEEAHALTPGAPDVLGKTAFAAAVLAFVEEDRTAARRHLTTGVDAARMGSGGDHKAVPTAGLLALLCQLDGDAEAAVPQRSDTPVHFLARAFHRYAAAVEAGREGDPSGAATLVAEADAGLGEHEWFRQLGRRLLAEGALADGWGQPVPWLREALAYFDRRGEQRIASACRSLLRRAGAAVPRRRGEDDVPGPLRAAGVTSRELEVLQLLALGMSNKAIAARLYLSPRTVERHVANIVTKIGVAGRSELVAFAARTVGGDTPAG